MKSDSFPPSIPHVPPFLRYVDIWAAIKALRAILESGEYRRPEFKRIAAET